jgi:hypothetical protein
MANIILAYFLLAMVCTCLLTYVMIKYLEQQRGMKKTDQDSPWLRLSRKYAFLVCSLLMSLSAATAWRTGEISPYIVLILLASIVMILSFNAISQHRRTPPEDRGSGIEEMPWPGSLSAQFGHYISRADMELIRAEILRVDEGQMLTHKYLEDMRNHLQIKPLPATIPADTPDVIVLRPRRAEEK